MKRTIATALLLLAACGPISPEAAADRCEERARLAVKPRGQVTVGIGTDGPFVSGEVGVSADFLEGRDPLAVYEQCVRQATGQPPIRPPDLS